ncbi:hypothetical protein DPMN_100031 [Dreissena polymorpha]|uniref:Uncharacterized protein n=1 Tax=Dreissena polymorpha TaxID=45954 RepID=A0A9D4LGM7_DREPO|nr:hypothetical protein DPMN_100031 [Dreissena polymorpha]
MKPPKGHQGIGLTFQKISIALNTSLEFWQAKLGTARTGNNTADYMFIDGITLTRDHD